MRNKTKEVMWFVAMGLTCGVAITTAGKLIINHRAQMDWRPPTVDPVSGKSLFERMMFV